MRPFRTVRALLPLLALAAFWWARPDDFALLLQTGFPIDLGSADQPRELFVPTVAIIVAPLVLRFGLPLVLKAALLLPFAATALTHRAGRGATFDPARDLANDSFTPGSQQEAAVDKAIAAALAACNAASAKSPAPIRPFGRQDAAA